MSFEDMDVDQLQGLAKQINSDAQALYNLVTNLTGVHGWSTAVVTSNSGGYQAYPIAPRMAFVTLSAKLD